MLIGQDRSGKTSLKKSLQGLRFNPEENSTDGIYVDPSHFKVTTEIWKAGMRDQAGDKEEMAISFEHRVARVVFENLREQELTSEAHSVSENSEILEDPTELSPEINHGEVGLSVDSFSTTQIEPVEGYADSPNLSGAAHADGGSQVLQTTDNYQTEMNARGNDSSEMIPKEIETLIMELGDRVDKMESEDYLYSVLWDFAGESVYYETHQLFLTSRAVYLLVYDLSRDPDEIAQPVEKQGIFKKVKEKSCTKTNLDYLDYWMTSVSSQPSQIEDHNLYSPSTGTILPKTLPPVFLVCTHSDKPFGGKDPSELAVNLYGSLETKPYSTQLYHEVFVVDNTKSGKQKECSAVQRLRNCILDVIKELPHTNEYIPIKWLRYEKALKVVLDEGHKMITFEHARRIASEVCQIHDHQEFLTVLDFLHDQRIIIHFDDTDELNELLVLDPQWLIDVFKKVITVRRFDRIERGFKNLWLKLEREGILEEKLLKHMWGSLAKEHHTFENLIAIMEKFSLLCSWSSSDEPFSKKYLVPSMLKCYPPQEITKLITSARLPSLFVKFESGHSPSNLFPRLVVQFLQWGKKKNWSIVDPHLYKNFFRFYTKDKNCSVVFLCHSSLIEVVVHAGNDPSLKDDSQANLGNSPADQSDSFEVFCAREVFRQLMLLLECLREEFCWLKRMKYQAGAICPVCCHERIIKYCTTHDTQDCEQEECLHFIPESELRNANQPITCTRWPAAVVPGGKTGERLSSYPEDKPPQLRVTLKKTSDIQVISKDLNQIYHLPIDILLVTVEDCEFLSCLPFLDIHFKSYISENGFVYFGRMGGYSCDENLKVGLMCCSKGSTIPGGPLPMIQTAMRTLQPKAVVSVGVCSSLVPEKVKMGDVVIPSKLISAEGSFHVPVSPRFNGLVQDAPYGWVAPLKNQGELELKVHRDGDVLSQSLKGKSRCDILKQYPGAVASETECKDVYSACYLANTEWVVVKGVASYFHQSESATSEWMSFASTMAASVVARMLNDPRVFLQWPHCSQVHT
ncbi:uncharacterized protein LOC114967473 [Acropora millepora]|uniref:uncharacterized protein LOC114967473 n=1 Tax=Acropora millepora TaxID=45264 RepID=UPI001CF3CF31|nr:uncharacterized protein LOC114967473 [Acropora millepora]